MSRVAVPTLTTLSPSSLLPWGCTAILRRDRAASPQGRCLSSHFSATGGQGSGVAGTSKPDQTLQPAFRFIHLCHLCLPPRQGVGCSGEPLTATTGGISPWSLPLLHTAQPTAPAPVLLFGDTPALLMFQTGEFLMGQMSCVLWIFTTSSFGLTGSWEH